ncbi:hypothetical protein BDY19DRAFT_998699 [Irpex rosettiformis]|uniref:Uncharacterized protein n=1 Tax=Irpex rosettiformis TaxID=378272 RepID=A0ACB8TMN2_9APHY|nr:hypothetical protein BDY19DRAFT_998699 [Irpex rosettiformis]
MPQTYHVDFKEALLEPQDWESLIHEKEYKISLAASQDTLVRVKSVGSSSSRGNDDDAPYGVLGRGFDVVVDAASSALKAVVSYADRQNAEIQARTVLSRLRVGSVCRDCGYVGDVRMELLRLHRMALKGRYSVSTRTKIAQTRVHWISTYFVSRPEPMDSVVYKDLVELLSLVCTDEYPATLLQEVWNIFLQELRSDGDARPTASALVQCDAGDIYLILRHLAASYILAWSAVPSGQHAIESERDARQAARKLAFAWNTYDGYVRATEGFHRLIKGVLLECPRLVHAAFDDTRLHLLWLKFLPPNSKTLSYERIIDSAVTPFLHYPKRLNPSLPLELQSITLFIATREPGTLAHQAATHIAQALSALCHPTHIDNVYTSHPSLVSSQLAHPALPFLLFAASLFQQSSHAAHTAVNAGILESVFSLWRAGFPSLDGHTTGQWVHPDKRVKAMRIASALLVGALAMHEAVYPLVSAKVLEREVDQETFWDVVAFALARGCVEGGKKWGMEEVGRVGVRALGFYVMKHHGAVPGDVGRSAAVGNVDNMVWILQASGDVAVDLRLRSFALDVLIARIMAPSISWEPAVAILSTCRAEEKEALKGALSEFVDHYLKAESRQANNCDVKTATTITSATTSTTTETTDMRLAFMRNPLDRFVMFVSNASRTNRYVAGAIAESEVVQLVRMLLSGEFDGCDDDDEEEGGGKGGRKGEAKEWRRRTCVEMMRQRRMKAFVGCEEVRRFEEMVGGCF